MKQSRLKTSSCFLTKKTRLKLPCFAMVAGAGLERFLLRLSSPLAHAPWFIFQAKTHQSEPFMSHLYEEPACCVLSLKSKPIFYPSFITIIFKFNIICFSCQTLSRVLLCNKTKNHEHYSWFFILVAGAGLEPATFGL